MKRSTDKKIQEKVKAWKDVQSIIYVYSKKDDASLILVEDLRKLVKSYEHGVFKACVEE